MTSCCLSCWLSVSHPVPYSGSSHTCSDAMSDPLPMTFGVPQGSILGLLLFLVSINDLPLAIENCEVTLYADDIILYYFAKEPHLLEEALNEDLLRGA